MRTKQQSPKKRSEVKRGLEETLDEVEQLAKQPRPKKRELNPADRVSPARPALFQTADHQAKLPRTPDLKAGFNEIAKKLFDSPLDIQQEFDIIEASLSIKGALTPAVLMTAANHTEDMARRAYRLYICAKVEYEAYMRETEVSVAAIRDAATARLEREKASRIRTKQITEGDVAAYCASEYPDEWEEVSRRRDRAKYMLSYLEQLSALAKTRCFTVAKMLKPGNEV